MDSQMTDDGSSDQSQLLITLERIAIALEKLANSHERLGDHFVPAPPKIVGTPYVANKLGCTTVWITELIRNQDLPPDCIVPGTGNGKPWKLYLDRIDKWITSR